MKRGGTYMELHFSMMRWLLAGPVRTRPAIKQQFHVKDRTARLVLDAALRLGYVKSIGRYQWGRVIGSSGYPPEGFEPVLVVSESTQDCEAT